MLYSSTVIVIGSAVFVLLIAAYFMLRRRGKLKRFDTFWFVIAVVAYIGLFLVLYNANAAFRHDNQPAYQSGTVWKSDDGGITIVVGDSSDNHGTLTRDGVEYNISLWSYFYNNAPQIVSLSDDDDVLIDSANFYYRMPNDHTAIYTPMDDSELSRLFMGGEERIILRRVDG